MACYCSISGTHERFFACKATRLQHLQAKQQFDAYRAVKKAEQRGLPAYELEFWVENLIQLAKSAVRDRTPLHPDLLLVNQLLLHAALKRLRLVHGAQDELPYLQTFFQHFG